MTSEPKGPPPEQVIYNWLVANAGKGAPAPPPRASGPVVFSPPMRRIKTEAFGIWTQVHGPEAARRFEREWHVSLIREDLCIAYFDGMSRRTFPMARWMPGRFGPDVFATTLGLLFDYERPHIPVPREPIKPEILVSDAAGRLLPMYRDAFNTEYGSMTRLATLVRSAITWVEDRWTEDMLRAQIKAIHYRYEAEVPTTDPYMARAPEGTDEEKIKRYEPEPQIRQVISPGETNQNWFLARREFVEVFARYRMGQEAIAQGKAFVAQMCGKLEVVCTKGVKEPLNELYVGFPTVMLDIIRSGLAKAEELVHWSRVAEEMQDLMIKVRDSHEKLVELHQKYLDLLKLQEQEEAAYAKQVTNQLMAYRRRVWDEEDAVSRILAMIYTWFTRTPEDECKIQFRRRAYTSSIESMVSAVQEEEKDEEIPPLALPQAVTQRDIATQERILRRVAERAEQPAPPPLQGGAPVALGEEITLPATQGSLFRREVLGGGVREWTGAALAELDIRQEENVLFVFEDKGDTFYYLSQKEEILYKLVAEGLGAVDIDFVARITNGLFGTLVRAYKVNTPSLVIALYEQQMPGMMASPGRLFAVNALMYQFAPNGALQEQTGGLKMGVPWRIDASAPEYLIWARIRYTVSLNRALSAALTPVEAKSVPVSAYETLTGAKRVAPATGFKDVVERFQNKKGAGEFMPQLYAARDKLTDEHLALLMQAKGAKQAQAALLKML